MHTDEQLVEKGRIQEPHYDSPLLTLGSYLLLILLNYV